MGHIYHCDWPVSICFVGFSSESQPTVTANVIGGREKQNLG